MAHVSATDLIGGGSATAMFSIGISAGASREQTAAKAIVDAQKQEINRIRGYKITLTPAAKQRLSEIKGEIVNIDTRASKGLVRFDELDDRVELLAEADEIIGKPTIDVEADEKLGEYAETLQVLLNPILSPTAEKRVDQLIRVKDNIEANMLDSPESATLRAQFQNIAKLIEAQNPPRQVSALSISERTAYDDLANLINERAGVKIQLNSRDAIRVAALEASVLELQSQLPPDASSQPTSQQVSRAYARLG